MNEGEVLDVLAAKGALRKGHFRLSSGRHSDLFAQKFRVLEHPGMAQRFGEELARRFDGAFDVVASPAVGALVLGFTTALAGGARFVFTERDEQGAMVFRRGFTIAPHERVLVVEDVVTTGGSAREVIDLVTSMDCHVVGLGALVDRMDPSRRHDLGVRFEALVALPTTSWDPEECPLCAEGSPLEDPGSRRVAG